RDRRHRPPGYPALVVQHLHQPGRRLRRDQVDHHPVGLPRRGPDRPAAERRDGQRRPRRPVSSVSEPAPIAIITGSRTATASGPMVRLARLVRSATTAPSANASKVAISPIQISPYPSASAACAVRTTSAAGRSCHSPSDTDSLTASFYHSVSCIVTA